MSTAGDHYFEKPLEFALYKCSFYECGKCSEPFFGGLVDCELEMAQEEERKNVVKEDLRCQPCLLEDLGAGSDDCKKHGKTDIDFKCCYCCSVALFHCGGNFYFCDPCHAEYCANGCKVELKDCGGVNCPLGVRHPPADNDPNQSVFPLGCGLCRTEELDTIKSKLGVVQIRTEEAFAPKVWDGYKA